MRTFGCATLVLLLLSTVASCDSSENKSVADVADVSADVADTGTHETGPGACNGLSQEECETSEVCEPYLAWTRELACATGEPAEPPAFMGCGIPEGRVCSSSWTWAYSTDAPEDWRMFINGCLPEGWTTGEGADLVCDAQPCEGLPQADCESTYHCFPIFGAPLLDGCTKGESEYAGCWTAEKLEDGEVVGFSCATVGTWAHPADAPEEWYRFVDSCVPDGWVVSEQPPCE